MNQNRQSYNEQEEFNAIAEAVEKALWWNGQEMNHGGDLVWVSTKWAMRVKE